MLKMMTTYGSIDLRINILVWPIMILTVCVNSWEPLRKRPMPENISEDSQAAEWSRAEPQMYLDSFWAPLGSLWKASYDT